MTARQELLLSFADRNRQEVLQAERWLWTHPETGFKEWNSHGYLAEKFRSLGYILKEAGNIPGFYTDIDTGTPGPTVCVMGELDALAVDGHPEAVNGLAHSCGHHAQGAALLGLAGVLREEGALDGLCGKIRLMMVPAEELIEMDYREQLRRQGTIRYFGGKIELLSRGFFDGVDIAVMMHAGTGSEYDIECFGTHVGLLAKTFTYKGRASHAGSAPDRGINAEYAASLGLQAVNCLRETFRDSDHIRVHPILHGVQSSVNIIPDRMDGESYVRGLTLDAILRENRKINRALAGAAAAVGAALEIHDRPGYMPESDSVELRQLMENCCREFLPEEKVRFRFDYVYTASSDFGDITSIMPGVQFHVNGCTGKAHGVDFRVEDPERLCMNAVRCELLTVSELLRNRAEKAYEVIHKFVPRFSSVREYLDAVDAIHTDIDAVVYDSANTARITF